MGKIDNTLKDRYELNETMRLFDEKYHKKHPMEAMRMDYAFRHQEDRPELLEEIMQQELKKTNEIYKKSREMHVVTH